MEFIMSFRKIFIFSLILSFYSAQLLAESAFQHENVVPGRVIVEFNLQPNVSFDVSPPTGNTELDAVLMQIGAEKLNRHVPNHRPNIYQLVFDDSHSVEEAVTRLKSCSIVIEAEPEVLVPYCEIRYNTNDMRSPGEWHLEAIDAPRAWGMFKGDTSVQVGIIDGGVAYMHEDLHPNIWINLGEDLNGNGIIDPADEDSIDTDNNGFIDDFWGWDWIDLNPSQLWPGEDPGPPDNDPDDFDGHGTHCAGDACGASDNGIGIASPGFNCQIMSLRAGYLSNSGQGYVDLYAAFQAVYYAIDMGAEVLSMSFGGGSAGFFSTALQDADNAGLVLVAAAGNDSSPNIQYPAGYPFVIAVAATAEGDYLADFTNYGTWITLCAPGDAILSTQPTGYGNMGGTSMATPIVAGACAMVKSLMPEWDSNEVGDWLAQSADNIDAQNPSYIGMMGGGRLNLANAVETGEFREDLYWRLKIISIALPPLRDRAEDIPELAEYFLGRFKEEYRKSIRRLSEAALEKLRLHSWPGNVRELENCMKRAVLLCSGDVIQEEHIKLETENEELLAPRNHEQLIDRLRDKLDNLIPDILRLSDQKAHANIIELVEEMLISRALKECGNNQVKTARMLGISRNTLRHRMKKYDMKFRNNE